MQLYKQGTKSGTSQHAYKTFNANNRVVWNLPFEAHYQTTELIGWPQMVLTCSGKDFLGREVVYGYSTTHCPVKEGQHCKYIPSFTPISSSWLVRFYAFFAGKNAEFNMPINALAKCEGREGIANYQ